MLVNKLNTTSAAHYNGQYTYGFSIKKWTGKSGSIHVVWSFQHGVIEPTRHLILFRTDIVRVMNSAIVMMVKSDGTLIDTG